MHEIYYMGEASINRRQPERSSDNIKRSGTRRNDHEDSSAGNRGHETSMVNLAVATDHTV